MLPSVFAQNALKCTILRAEFFKMCLKHSTFAGCSVNIVAGCKLALGGWQFQTGAGRPLDTLATRERPHISLSVCLHACLSVCCVCTTGWLADWLSVSVSVFVCVW